MSTFSQRFLVLLSSLLLVSTVFASPITPSVFKKRTPRQCKQHCKNPLVRKEWRALSENEKHSYIKAVQCLGKKAPIVKSMKASMSRFDDFVAVHSSQTDNIHFVGHFLHWHRYFLAAYEKALRTECGYTGAQPYWNWIIDAQSDLDMEDYPIFSSTNGFGGNGEYIHIPDEENWMGLFDRTGGGCVKNGPFTADKFTVAVNIFNDVQTANPRCLQRDFCPQTFKREMKQEVIDELMEKTTFAEFARRMEALPGWSMTNIHGGGHFGVGGVLGNMGDMYNSPGDPVFYLHHTMLDKIWTEWQGRNYKRIYDVGGPVKAFDYQGTNITLDFKINLDVMAPELRLADVSYTKGKHLCYVYE